MAGRGVLGLIGPFSHKEALQSSSQVHGGSDGAGRLAPVASFADGPSVGLGATHWGTSTVVASMDNAMTLRPCSGDLARGGTETRGIQQRSLWESNWVSLDGACDAGDDGSITGERRYSEKHGTGRTEDDGGWRSDTKRLIPTLGMELNIQPALTTAKGSSTASRG
ncbi:hypothetical protein EYF80_028942 [Liparis tanakae]|uniref:Uncharacterized protein n=1 Tax=Liparis tanakae TaxID=230148 RepID=A0A4Z2H6G6_9TELE|nr:hypothetical protein EYF80_028942 [Liparis tanakae]